MSNLSDFLQSDLDRLAIGQIRDFINVAPYYDLGTNRSKWVRTGSYVATTYLSAAFIATLQASAAPNDTMAVNSDATFDTGGGFSALRPVARIASTSISCVPAAITGATAVAAGVMTAAGLQLQRTGQTSIIANNANGGNGSIISIGTDIFSYAFSGANTLTCYKLAADGLSWASQSLSVLPTFSVTSGAKPWPSGSTVSRTPLGDKLDTNSSEFMSAMFCGVKVLILASDGTNVMASLSTGGLVFGGDNTAAVLNAVVAKGVANVYHYNNGNANYLSVGAVPRYSSDGGATWANSTNPPGSTAYYKVNTTTPAKLVAVPTGSTAAKFSANSGQTWTSQTLPEACGSAQGIVYTGSTCLMVGASLALWRSTDDGATWALVTLPVATAGSPYVVFGDANRFYLIITSAAQILTSTTGATGSWTIRTTPITIASMSGITSFNSSAVLLTSPTYAYLTTDGGVTWKAGALDTVARTSVQGGDCYTTPDGGGYGFLGVGGDTNTYNVTFALTDVTSGGAFSRTGASAITPVQTNAFTYAKVA